MYRFIPDEDMKQTVNFDLMEALNWMEPPAIHQNMTHYGYAFVTRRSSFVSKARTSKMMIVFLLAFAFLHICTSREIVKKNAVIFYFKDTDERDLAFDDKPSIDDEVVDFNVDKQGPLEYPGDCHTKRLINFAKKGGCTLKTGPHISVYRDGKFVTSIPHNVKDNPTCESIIDELNEHCSKAFDMK
ncbi:hypothetical protein MAR_005252 [Mya arenaria]|uniref:Uncharacterized protein n=1 Tax=Mya arenaria TaxID=6604 RepID=A0ABY7F254_MYAAR|nr:hypothetical protein MAR_005252 [Mya arenaria]